MKRSFPRQGKHNVNINFKTNYPDKRKIALRQAPMNACLYLRKTPGIQPTYQHHENPFVSFNPERQQAQPAAAACISSKNKRYPLFRHEKQFLLLLFSYGSQRDDNSVIADIVFNPAVRRKTPPAPQEALSWMPDRPTGQNRPLSSNRMQEQPDGW